MKKREKREAKEIRKKRREMELTIWRKMSSEEKATEIEARKAKSTSEYQKKQQQADVRRVKIKLGREFAKKNQVRFFSWNFGGYGVTAGALLKTGENNLPYYLVAYTICSTKDSFSSRTGEGYVGDRLMKEDHPYRFEIMLAKRGALSDKRLNALCYNHIVMDIVAKRTRVPGKLEGHWLRWLWYEHLEASK